MNQVRLLRRHEKGSILGMAAISMTAILLAVGLAIDVGHWYLVGGELQNAADASALAAASALDLTEGGITQAVQRATATVNQYEFSGIDATISADNVKFAAALTDFDSGSGLNETQARAIAATVHFVKVTVPPKSVGVFFASLATNSATISLSRSAVAGFSVGLNRFGNIVPFALMENPSDATSPNLLNFSGCVSTGVQFERGCQYTVKVSPGNQTPAAGEYIILDLPSSRSDDFREVLGIGSDGYVTSGQVISVLPGDKTGQTLQGLEVRFDQYQAYLNPATYPPDANITQNITRSQYREAAHFTAPQHPGVWDRRVLVIPIITPSQYIVGTPDTITPTKFGAFFMMTSVGNGAGKPIQLEYLGTPAVLGNGGYDPNGGPGTIDITTAVLYR